MKTPLALLNLWHQRAKTLVSVGGVAFALLLVFMQLGFMGAVSHTATNVLENLQFDVLMRARDYLHLYEPGRFERKWLQVAASTRGVEAAKPLWVTIHNWRKLPTLSESKLPGFETHYLPIAVMAFDTQEHVFKLESVVAQSSRLHSGREVLLDQSTQRDYGPFDGRRFSERDIGRATEIGGQAFSIGGVFALGTGLAANGAAIASQQGFARLVPWDVNRAASLGLIDVAPGAPIDQVVSELKRRVAVDAGEGQRLAVDVFSRAEALEREEHRWLFETPIGLIFQMGVVLSLMVGGAIVYMVLATDVSNRLPEYATLLAVGYSRTYLASLVMTQALVFSGGGFLLAWGGAQLLYRFTSLLSGIGVAMNSGRLLLVLALGLGMCCASGMLALRKLWKAEPASLF